MAEPDVEMMMGTQPTEQSMAEDEEEEEDDDDDVQIIDERRPSSASSTTSSTTSSSKSTSSTSNKNAAAPASAAAAAAIVTDQPSQPTTTATATKPTTKSAPTAEDLAQAEEFKNQGNTLYKSAKYRESIEYYTKAIDICPDNAAYYGNRAAAYFMLDKFKETIEDSKRSVSIDEKFVKGYLREGKSQLIMGDYNAALRCFEKVKQYEPNNKTMDADIVNARAVKEFAEKADASFKKADYRTVIYFMDRCLQHSTRCAHFQLVKAECLTMLGRYQEAQEIANDIVMRDQTNSDALYVRGMCLYYQDNTEKAFQHFQRVLQYTPDHDKAKVFYRKAKQLQQKKEQGNQAFRAGNWQEAYNLYTESLEIDPFNKTINASHNFDRATTSAKV